MNMYFGEYRRYRRCPLCLQLNLTIHYVLTGFLQNTDHVIGGTTAEPDQEQLHRCWPLGSVGIPRRTVDKAGEAAI